MRNHEIGSMGEKFRPASGFAMLCQWLAAILLSLILSGCGGGGSAGSGATSSASPPAAMPDVDWPFVAGKKWLYNFSRRVAVPAKTTIFNGQAILQVKGQTSWQGRQAWRLMRYELETVPAGTDAFNASPEYLFEDADGLERWISGTSEWKRILSSMFTSFGGNALIMTREPNSNSVTTLSGDRITVAAGDFDVVRANAKYREGFFVGSIVDHSENHFEYYADGVGLIKSSWDFFYQDQNIGLNVVETGGAELLAVDSGAFPALVDEVEPNHGLATAQSVGSDYAIVAAETHINDAGLTVVDANVNANDNGQKKLQDLYNFSHNGGNLRIDLNYESFKNGVFNDVDLYLFRRGNLGQLIYVASSTNDPALEGDRESISTFQAAGTYTIAVQAWKTLSSNVAYWYQLR